MIDGIIFDIDGTIWDSTEVVQKAWNKALEERGYKERVNADRLKGLFGLPMMDIITDIVPYETTPNKEEFLKLCSKYEFEYLNKEAGRVYDGTEEVLKCLSKKVPLGIVSNCQSGYIELLYEKTGFGSYFKQALCPGDRGLLKADNIKLLAKECNMSNPVYVGDTHMDELACEKAGVRFIHAAYGFGKAVSPWKVINSPSELCDMNL